MKTSIVAAMLASLTTVSACAVTMPVPAVRRPSPSTVNAPAAPSPPAAGGAVSQHAVTGASAAVTTEPAVQHPCAVLSPRAVASLQARIHIAGPGTDVDNAGTHSCDYNHGATWLSITASPSAGIRYLQAHPTHDRRLIPVPDIAGHPAARVDAPTLIPTTQCALLFDSSPRVVGGVIAAPGPGDPDRGHPCPDARSAAAAVARAIDRHNR